MAEGSSSSLLPLLLLVAVVGAVGLILYSFALDPADAPQKPGERPEEPEPPPDVRPDVVPTKDDGKGPKVVPARAGSIFSGVVVDENDRPVAGATVFLYGEKPPLPPVRLDPDQEESRAAIGELYQRFPEDTKTLYPLGSRPIRAAIPDEAIAVETTRDNGEFRFTKPYYGRHRLTARMDRRHSGEILTRGGKPVTLKLAETAELFGLVRFRDDSRPIEGATVRVRSAGVDRSIVTKGNGTFRLEGLPAGNVSVDVTHPEYAGEILRKVRLQAGVEKELEVQLTKGYTLTITVRDIDDENDEPPIPAATVAALRIADDGYVIGKSDENGMVVFTGLPPGRYFLNGVAPDFITSGEEPVRVQKDTDYDLYLERAVYSTLVVVDESDIPIPGATIMTSDPDEEWHEKISRTVGKTDRDGQFRFAFDFDGMRALVYVMKEGYAVGVVTPDDPYESETIRVVLPTARIVRGQVRDEAGRPISGAKVYLEVMGDDAEAEDLAATLFTDGQGRYRWDHLPAGDVWLEVEKDGYLPGEADFETGPQTEHVKNFVLEKEEDE
ncbi:MAG: carboxypeptidase-like regulatory domain-containing protein [Planctomycetota bacterium]